MCKVDEKYNYAIWSLLGIPGFPPGMPYGFVRILFLFFLFFRRQGFRMITFDRQAGPLHNFNRSHIMVIGRSVSFSDPARPPGGAWGAPNTPKSPPPPKNKFCLHAFQKPRNIFEKKYLVGKRPQEHFLANFFFSVKNSILPPPPPPACPRPVLRTSCNNK